MDKDEIVIATDNREKALFIVAKTAVTFDEMEITYIDKYAPTVEYILRILRKGFGWIETDRGEKTVYNTICKYKIEGICTNEKVKNVTRCNESIRLNCKKYVRKSRQGFEANTVTIEKAGGIRGM